MADLVTTTDLGKFEAGDRQWFLDTAESAVRDYCDWHIAPSRREVDRRCEIGERGIIMLHSLHVTEVESVKVDGQVLEPDEYDWDEAGFITRTRTTWPRGRYWPVFGLPSPRYAYVTFTHGYPEVPLAVKAVILELASSGIELPSSVATEATGGPFRIKFKGTAGLSLNDDHRSRLADYRIQAIA
ncbi:Uncharacterised protein [Mycobacteroides abscessus subsp. abscessus]|uniref:hypothetical protein n=1 Tax=Mycobacteroides abscessus TaxID=36809 RepID=UPI0009A5AE4C|nr:hypothetical protein [Mycobacteroides abscessus]SKU30720.1 Uncharacterised protein [Mycobacteroides abscessus subsp. abscessus]